MCGMESERWEDFGDGGTDCHGQCSHWPRNDIGFSWGCGVRRGTWAPPYKGLYNIAGGQSRPPLRRGARSAVGRADVGIGPYGENLGRAKKKNKRIPKYPLAFDRSEELEVLDDVNDFGTDALLSLQSGGADMSGRLENVPVAHF